MAADFYRELGVSRRATPDVIKKAYKRLVAELHPDRNPGDARKEDRFKRVNRAYSVLADPELRKRYDLFGEPGLGAASASPPRSKPRGARRSASREPPGFPDFDEFLEGFMKARRGPPADSHAQVTLTFGDAITGVTLNCRIPGTDEAVQVRVPSGAEDGDVVRVRGKGAPGGKNRERGDLLITLTVGSDPHFRRSGIDLHLELPISVGEAFHGAKVTVPTPKGNVALKVPGGTESGSEVRLRGYGVPRAGQVGDMYVRFLVRIPTSGGEQVKLAIDTLESAMATEDLRKGIAL